MQLKNFNVSVHNLMDKNKPTHVDVELNFKGAPDTIKMCNCTAYMGGMDAFGSVEGIAAQVREDLAAIANNGEHVMVARDTVDGSIDLLRERDKVLLFSMEADNVDGAEWLPDYDSGMV